jgi:hypothetical protein
MNPIQLLSNHIDNHTSMIHYKSGCKCRCSTRSLLNNSRVVLAGR